MSSRPQPAPPPEFSRPLSVETMPADSVTRTLEATPDECRALAARFRLQSVDALSATVRVTRLDGGRGGARIAGRLTAQVVQTCVVTLEPVPTAIEDTFSALVVPRDRMPSEEDELVLDPSNLEDDLPEPLENGIFDLGELTAQHLSLALDPYPRRAGVEFSGFDDDAGPDAVTDGGNAADPPTHNPFARALGGLKRGG